MSLIRKCKALVYPWSPSTSFSAHGKRRKGLLYRSSPPEVLESQKEQDRIFWRKFLHPEQGGQFLEIGAGDGVVGSHTLGLELLHGWDGAIWEPHERPRAQAGKARKCLVWSEEIRPGSSELIRLFAIHRPHEFLRFWDHLIAGRFKPAWVIVENREPDPRWCRLLEGSGYRLKFYFHDDEYFQLTSG